MKEKQEACAELAFVELDAGTARLLERRAEMEGVTPGECLRRLIERDAECNRERLAASAAEGTRGPEGRRNRVRGETRRKKKMVRGGPGWLALRVGWAWRVADFDRVVAGGFVVGEGKREAARAAARAGKRAYMETGNAEAAQRAGETAARSAAAVAEGGAA